MKEKFLLADSRARIFLITHRDNPLQKNMDRLPDLFSELVDFFRTPEGHALVLWPMTREESASKIAKMAWNSGRDSMCDSNTKGLLPFTGLEKVRYRDVADRTALSLFGDGLLAFGITTETATDLTQGADTISDYLGRINDAAENIRGDVYSVLKEKIIPRLWVVVPGDDVAKTEAVVRALTQGSRGAVDVSLMQEYIDNASDEVQYVKEWQRYRSHFSHLMRVLDVRIFALPPNAAVLAARAFGPEQVTKNLKTKTPQRAVALDAFRSTRLYKELATACGIDAGKYAGARSVKSETENEYIRIQRLAASDDKPLNKALAGCIQESLKQDGFSGSVHPEKKMLKGTGLQPDVMVEVSSTSYICIEPTWRSSGKGVEGELPERQATLTEAHIKKYVMDKALEFVKAYDF